MSFIYDIGAINAEDVAISAVRLEIGDETENAGVKPDGTNFSDEEILYFYGLEGTHNRTVARCLETLARQYARLPRTRVGPHDEDPQTVAARLRQQAADLRARYGYGDTQAGIVTVAPIAAGRSTASEY